LYSTSNEKATPRAASAARKKLKKRKLDADEKSYATVPRDSSVKNCRTKMSKVTSKSSSTCDCEATLCDSETGRKTCQRRCRGWFPPSWPQPVDSSGHSSSNSDCQFTLNFVERLTHHASLQLAELQLGSSSATKWLELKRSQTEDREKLLSSPVGVLWQGHVKPLIQPSQATSVGKLIIIIIITFFTLGIYSRGRFKN